MVALRTWTDHVAARLARALRATLAGAWQLRVEEPQLCSAEEPAELTDPTELTWSCLADPLGEPVLQVQISHDLIESVAAQVCGLGYEREPRPRAPSLAELRLFQPVGRAITDELTAAWRDDGLAELGARGGPEPADLGWTAAPVVRIGFCFSGQVQGRCELGLSPAALPQLRRWHRGERAALMHSLAEVELEVVVELGRQRVSVEAPELTVGGQLVLATLVDDRVPIFVAGALKAWGRPVIDRGVLAVQVMELVPSQEDHRTREPPGRAWDAAGVRP